MKVTFCDFFRKLSKKLESSILAVGAGFLNASGV